MTNANVKEDMSDWIFPIKYGKFSLSDSFLEKYKDKQPNWPNVLSYITYKRTYARIIDEKTGATEEFWQTVKRVVEACYTVQLNHCKNLKLYWNAHKAQKSAQKMFELIWNQKFSPPGRGLWAFGSDVVWKKGASALNNCAFISTEDIDFDFSGPFKWFCLMSMYGVGIGYNCSGAGKVTIKEPKYTDNVYIVEDTRESWAALISHIIDSYIGKTEYPNNIDYSKIRPEGSLIKTFGGICPGYKPLKECIDDITKVLNKIIGQKIKSTDIVDLFNVIGKAVVAGGVRRVASLSLGDINDEEYLEMKNPEKYGELLKDWRWASNNSVYGEIGMNYNKVVENLSRNGEPGIIYLENMKKYGRFKDGIDWKDEQCGGVNPCITGDTLIAVADGRNAISIKQLTEEGKDVPVYSITPEGKVEIKMGRNPRITGYDMELLEVILDDGTSIKVTPNHKFLLKNGDVKEAKDLKSGDSLQRFQKRYEIFNRGKNKNNNKYVIVNTDINDIHNRKTEHRLIYEFYKKNKWDEKYNVEKANGWKTGGVVIHHKDYNGLNNSIDNLELMTFKEHSKFHGNIDQSGEKNGMYGKKHSEETKKLIGSKSKKRFESEEYKNKMSIALKKAMNNKETKDKLRKSAKNRWLKIYKEIEENDIYNVNIKNGRLYINKDCERNECNNKFELPYEKRNEVKYCSNECRHMNRPIYNRNINIETSIKNIQEYNKKKFQEFEKTTDLETVWINDRLYVKKTCEAYDCNNEMILPFNKREICYCSKSCGNKNKEDIEKRRIGQKKKFEEKSLQIKNKQIKIYKDLETQFGRKPFKKEWESECKKQKVSFRFNRKSDNPNILNCYKELKEEAELYNHRVKEVKKLNHRDTVYNITVDDNHTVGIVTNIKQNSMDGIFTSNCGEQILESYELCCLCELFPSKHETVEEFYETIKYAYLYAKTVTLIPTDDERTNQVLLRNRRIGLSMTGVVDAIEKHGTRNFFQNFCDKGYEKVCKLDKEYSKWFCVPESIKKSTNKPAGSTSLLAGVSSGIHWPHSEYYIRRMEIQKMSPLVEPLEKVGYKKQQSYYKKNSWVFEFPIHVENFRKGKNDVTIWEQLTLNSMMNYYWSDNCVSQTVTFKKEEIKDLKSALEYFEDKIKSVSFLPLTDHKYEQAPFEEITKDEYEKRMSEIKGIPNFNENVHDYDAEEKFCNSETCELQVK